MLRLSCRLVLSVAAVVLAGTRSAPAQPPTQLDRIEQKLDTILHQLKQPQSGVPVAAQPPAPTANPNQATASPAPDQAARSPAPDVLAAGALAIIRAAPVTPLAAREIPTDAVGGLIYTGGPLQLADLKEHGVHYNGLAGVEWQGWLRARETGRYELDLDGSSVSPDTVNATTCTFAGWLEDRPIGVQQAVANAHAAQPASVSLILGADLQPGLYKLRLWATCTPWARNLRVAVELLVKTPADLNFRPVTGDDLAHKQR
jgi:hypothetical protein